MVARVPDPPEEDPEDDSDEFSAPEETRGRKKHRKYAANLPALEAAKHLTFDQWAAQFLKIRDENGVLMPFLMRETQLRFNAILEEEIAQNGYARIIVLKARKEGISSVVQGRAVRTTVETPGWNAGVMAHADDACQAIFERARTMAENLPKGMRRPASKWNRKQIAYKAPHSSTLEVNVAKGRGGWARGSDKHFVHLSEVAFWPLIRGESRAQGQLIAVCNAVPRVAGTVVVIESTANGAGNEFHKLWKGAEDGTNGFRPIFFGWQDFPAYRMVGKTAEDFKALPEWVEDEPRLRQMGIDEEQLAWRRWKIAADCGGDVDAFKQEYPAYPEEAFLATGASFFPPSLVQERLLEIMGAEKAESDAGFPPRRFSFDSKGQPEESRGGELRFYRSTRGKDIDQRDVDRYVIVADPAGSSSNAPDQQKGDPACAYVWDREKNEQIAEWRGWCQPDEFASALYYLGSLYSNPLMIVEAGPFGGHVISGLQRLGYRNLYFRENLGDQLLNEPTNWGQYGWITSAKTKQLMLDALRELWRTGTVRINSLICCQEHITFVKKGPVKREAQTGCHDDTVMCCAIYAMWALHHPYAPRPTWQPKPAETYGDIIRDMLAKERSGRGQGGWRLW